LKSATTLKQPTLTIDIKASWDSLTSAFLEAEQVLFARRMRGTDYLKPAEMI
jgi:hypothetical protein